MWPFKFFSASTFTPKTFPENHVAFQVFLGEPTFATTTFPENHVAFQVFFLR